MTNQMNPSSETRKKLVEIGLLSAGAGDIVATRTIFDGIAAIRPESEVPLVGKAIAELCTGRYRTAVQLLREAVEKNPENDVAMGLLALALHNCGLNEASSTVAAQVVNDGENTEAIELAQAILEESGGSPLTTNRNVQHDHTK